MSKETNKLFVYGTLRRGYPLHRYLRKSGVRFFGKGIIRARRFDLGEFPGAVPSTVSAERVVGELYELSDPTSQLKELDEIEECFPEKPEHSLFVRRKADVRLLSGQACQAWVYFLARKPSKARMLSHGDYAASRVQAAAGHGSHR